MDKSRIDDSKNLSAWIEARLGLLHIVADGRAEYSITAYYVAWQHHAAIGKLFAAGLFAPGTALLRCMYDALVRGMWLQRGASTEELAGFRRGSVPPIKLMLARLEDVDSHNHQLMEHHQRVYGPMCDLTHTGAFQVRMQWGHGEVSANVPDELGAEILRHADAYALWALADAAVASNEQGLANDALTRMTTLRAPT